MESIATTASPPKLLERFLSLVGVEDPDPARSKLSVFLPVLLLHLASRDCVRFTESGAGWRLALAVTFALCFFASFFRSWRGPAVLVALSVMTFKLARVFPLNSNHFFVEYLCVLFVYLELLPERTPGAAKGPLTVQALKWLPLIVLFWSGVNKLSYGTYFDGAYPAYVASVAPHFRLDLLLPAAEIARLGQVSAPGPYDLHSVGARIVTNAVWISEIVFPLLLLIPRLRMLGLLAVVGVTVGIEAVAKELMFGLLFVNLVLLYLPGYGHRRVIYVFAALYAFLLGSKLGWFPEFYFN